MVSIKVTQADHGSSHLDDGCHKDLFPRQITTTYQSLKVFNRIAAWPQIASDQGFRMSAWPT